MEIEPMMPAFKGAKTVHANVISEGHCTPAEIM
jgi:hypothetical protein